MLFFGVAEEIENSYVLEKLPELLRQEDLTILFICVLSPDLWHEYPDIDFEFLTTSFVVKTDTSSKNLFLPQGTIFSRLYSKWTSPGFKQNQNVAGGRLQCL